MKRCPRCSKTYSDESLNFCLDDGELLTNFETDPPPTIFGGPSNPGFDDAPPTVLLNKPRVTNQTNWQPGGPIAPWQGQGQVSPMPNQQFGGSFPQSPDQTLPTISIILGAVSLLMVCCYGGIWLGLPAAVVGFIAMRNADSNPSRYGGKGLAIGGMVMGGITALISIIHIVIIIASLFAR
jgi:hypothetical protein